jgi:DNA-directed RNA polymerase specialized sigma24 family protein
MKADPRHEQAREALIRLTPSEAKACIGLTDYRDGDYVSSEVLAAIIRAQYGRDNGVLDVAARALYERTVKMAGAFLSKNPRWDRIARSSSETLADAVSYTWEKLLRDRALVSCAEVRFAYFLERKLIEFLRSSLALKNTAKSLESLSRPDEDGNERPYVEMLEDDSIDWPETAVAKAQALDALKHALFALEPLERQAVYLKVIGELDWKATANYLRCSVTTAKKHVQIGLGKLRGVKV